MLDEYEDKDKLRGLGGRGLLRHRTPGGDEGTAQSGVARLKPGQRVGPLTAASSNRGSFRARRVLAAAPKEVDPPALAAYVAMVSDLG